MGASRSLCLGDERTFCLSWFILMRWALSVTGKEHDKNML